MLKNISKKCLKILKFFFKCENISNKFKKYLKKNY